MIKRQKTFKSGYLKVGNNTQINAMSPMDVVTNWLTGTGGSLNFPPESEMSKIMSQDNSAKMFEDFVYKKFNGNPPYLGMVNNYGYKFTWPRALVTFNSAEQVVGSWKITKNKTPIN